MVNPKETKEIADAFNKKYATLWNENRIEELAKLYTETSILVGYATVSGRSDIAQLLQSIIDQGWNKIQIQTVKVELIGIVILVANEYQASGTNKDETLNAKSSQVLTNVGGHWMTAMHTPT